jgi:hypothetical protein
MAKLTTRRFSIPRNPNLISPSSFEVANDVPWFKGPDGRTIANQLGVARQHTARPQTDALGEVARMWVAPMGAGFLLTASKPDNSFFEFVSTVVAGHVLDAVMPAIMGIQLHLAVDAALKERKEAVELAPLAGGHCEVVPMIDIVEIDWRDRPEWRLNPLEHLTLVYGAKEQRVCTLVGQKLSSWIDGILVNRFLQECAGEFIRAKYELMRPVLEPVGSRFPGLDTITLGEMADLHVALRAAWFDHLAKHPELTNAVVWAQARRALDALAPQYREFPQFGTAIAVFDKDAAKPGQPAF